MKKGIIFITVFFITLSYAQKNKTTKLKGAKLGELKMTTYDKDSTANALVLYEHLNYYVDKIRDYDFTSDNYHKIKILKKEGFDKSKITIPIFDKERVHGIKARVYNLSKDGQINTSYLLDEKVYTKQINDKWKEVSFTLPNIKVGSVIEYVYSITSPYSQIDDWYFQSDIPKLRSDFTAAILGNWKYNIRVTGNQKLIRNDAYVEKNCIYIERFGEGDCSILSYGMDDIPAFEPEDYMLSQKNFISRLSFELESYTNVDGQVKKYTKTWKDADKRLKNNFLDNQTSKKNYFKKKVLDNDILSIKNELEKAIKIFNLVKGNFNWNGKYWPSRHVRVKKAYQNKVGNVFDINLSLFNALQAANIESNLALLATRNKGLPTKLYPIISEFNYLIVRAVVDNKVYFLDATKKMMPFGLIQYQALNGEVRIMDFKKGGNWEVIQLKERTSTQRKLSLELIDGDLKGELIVRSTGYSAFNKRNELLNKNDDDILNDFETKYPSFEVDDFKISNLEKVSKKLIESYKVTVETNFLDEGISRINPFLISRETENPFKLDARNYPVDFGYPRSKTYMLSLKVPENYEIVKIPENKSLSLPNKGGKFVLIVKKKQNTINLFLRIVINRKTYSHLEYHYLKEFYNQLIKTQDAFIEIKK